MNKAFQTDVQEFPSVNIVLLGKTGHGKSATGNTIFGDKRYKSRKGTSSTTHKCQLETGIIGERKIYLVDTPGTMDTNNLDSTLNEIGTAIAYRPEGFHAFLLVLNPDARMTSEEWMAITLLKKIFGEDVLLKYTILVYTHGDTFYDDEDIKEKDLLQYLEEQGDKVRNLVAECNKRCFLINNRNKDPNSRKQQVMNLLSLIDTLVDENKGKMYTNDLFEFAQRRLKEERHKLKEREEQIKRWREELELHLEQRAKILQLEKDMKELKRDKEALEERIGKEVGQQAKETDRTCFPPDALVRLQGGRIIAMADLQLGDKVLSLVSNANLEYSDIYLFAHLDPESWSEFICISASNHKVKLSPGHHIFIVCNGHTIDTVPAGNVNIGDRILVFDEKTSSLQEKIVTELSKSCEVGIYAPITLSGTIVVNNVLASCYVDIVPPKISHPLLWPLRKLYELSPTLSGRMNIERKDGMPIWIKWIIDTFLKRWK